MELTTDLLVDFLRATDLQALRAMLDAQPALLGEEAEPLLAAWLLNYAGDAPVTEAIEGKRDLLRACRAHGVAAVFDTLTAAPFAEAFDAYEQALSLAALRNDAAAWQAAADAGLALLAPAWRDMPGLDAPALAGHVANTLNRLGNALSVAGDPMAALAAYDRAVTLQPDLAIWRRNRASALIDLNRLDEAAGELAAARCLEPEAPRLAEMEQELQDYQVSDLRVERSCV
jgi:tetratricopeptide (TPR) repeat protein